MRHIGIRCSPKGFGAGKKVLKVDLSGCLRLILSSCMLINENF